MNQQEKQQEPAVLYVRVSTEEQAREGVSLGAQEARLRAYAMLRGLRVVEVVVDAGVSGGVPLDKRAGGQRLLEVVEAHQRVAGQGRGNRQRRPCHVLAVKLDRLFRSTVDALETTKRWADRGVSMHLVDMGGQAVDTSSSMGRFFLTMLASVAEMERGLIADRTSAALRHKRSKGEQISSAAPIGYRHQAGRVVADEKEQAILARICELRAECATLREIAADLNAKLDQYPARGARWHPATIQRALRGMEKAVA
jgi:DNA invertase Pin-like site-specific DNA recombinase